MFSVYILYSPSSAIYYIGYTDNVQKRFVEHNELSRNSFTSKHRPWILKASLKISESRSDAMKVESYIKKQKRTSFIEKVIEKQSDDLFVNWLLKKANVELGG